jgi:UDP-N-acetylglucosamine 2-epimerase (non-hydrolysing)
MNRVIATRLASLHFAPTQTAADNLLAEGVDRRRICITGNPGIDAMLYVQDALAADRLPAGRWPQLDTAKKLIVVTAHRRENFGSGFERICEALTRLARRDDVQLVYPVHRNPSAMDFVYQRLGGLANIFLIEPLDYVPFVDLMCRARLLITDSGGIQEEGPSLGKPVLVMREKTERPEAVAAGTVKLVGTTPDRIVREAERLLEDDAEYARMARIHNPYGNGRASGLIRQGIETYFGGVGVAELPPLASLPNVLPLEPLARRATHR